MSASIMNWQRRSVYARTAEGASGSHYIGGVYAGGNLPVSGTVHQMEPCRSVSFADWCSVLLVP